MHPQDLRTTLNDIKASHSLVEYAQSCGVNIRRSGQTIRAPYQFRSDDRNPSFTIWHNGAKDWATGEYYDLFKFAQIMKDCSFIDAVHEFAPDLFVRSNPEVPPELIERAEENQKALRDYIQKCHEAICPKSDVAEIFANPECTDPLTGEVVHVLDYIHSRGITDDTITSFKLGYDAKTKRLIIPFFKNGVPVYYSGRDLTSRCKTINPETGKLYAPKYLYPATDYGVEKIIFGLDSIRLNYKSAKFSRKNLLADIEGTLHEEKAQQDTLFICEGILDALILLQEGWQCLSSGGGAFGATNRPLVLDIMSSFPQVVLAYDNDKAGQNFTERTGKFCMTSQIKFTVAEIPETVNDKPVKDINDYFLAGGNITELVTGAKHGLSYLAESLGSVEDIVKFVKEVKKFADDTDLLAIKDLLKLVKAFPTDPDSPVPQSEPRFKKGDVENAFKAAKAKASEEELAERVLADHNLLLSADGKFYEYNGQYWEAQTDLTIKRYALDVQGHGGTIGCAGAVTQRLKAMLETKKPFNTQHIFPAKNGVFILDKGVLVPHNPQFMNTSVVGYTITVKEDTAPQSAQDKEEERIWLEATSGTIAMSRIEQLRAKRRAMALKELPLHALFEQAGFEKEKISAWQEFCATTFVDKQGRYSPELEREVQLMAGYIFCPDNRLQTGYILLGEGGNGKSTLMEILKDVFGREVCAFLRPDRLSNSFDVMLIRNAWVNFCHESAKNMNGAEETLKSVISGDPITGSYKAQDAVSFQSRAKWIISANSIMDIKDVSYGFLRRMICIPFYANHTRNKKPDVQMLERLHGCMNEIFWWCYQGYLAIQKGARPGQTKLQQELAIKLRETIDTCYLFTKEELVERRCPFFEPDSGSVISDREMFKWYVDWCKETFNDILPQYTAIDRITNAMRDLMPEMVHTRLTRIADHAERNYFVYTNAPVAVPDAFDEESQKVLQELGVIEAGEAINSPSNETPGEPESEASSSGVKGSDDKAIHDDKSPENVDCGDRDNEHLQSAGAPESEDKASAGEAETLPANHETMQDMYRKYPNAAGIDPYAFPLAYVSKMDEFREKHPDTWHTLLTLDEFKGLAHVYTEFGRKDFVETLREWWLARQEDLAQDKEITSDNQEGGAPASEPPEPEA